jgi:hypothetical protein
MMLTETALVGSVEERKRWMDESVAQVLQAREAGLPMVGYTWWPLFDMIEWDYRLENAPLFRYNMPVGLYANKFHVTESPNQWTMGHEGGDQWAACAPGAPAWAGRRPPSRPV